MSETGKAFTRGGQITFHNLRMWLQINIKVTKYAFYVLLLCSILLLFLFSDHSEVLNALIFYVAKGMVSLGMNTDHHLPVFFNGQRSSITINGIFNEGYYQIARQYFWHEIIKYLLISSVISIGSFVFLYRWLVARGESQTKNKIIRGSKLLSKKDLSKLKYDRSDIAIDGLNLNKNFEVQHTLIHGTIGSGKSQLIMKFLDEIKERGDRIIIYDKGCSFLPHYFDEKKDRILNPFDKRCVQWDLWSDASQIEDFEFLSQALIPLGDSENPFWINSARSLLTDTANRMKNDSDRSINNLLKMLLTADLDTIAQYLTGTESANLVDSKIEKTAITIKSVLATYLKSLRFLNGLETERFSIKEFIENDKNGSLFITSNAKYHTSIRSLISMWISIASNTLLSMEENRDRRIWFVLDELPSLQQINSLPGTLAECRKFGGSFILGMQSQSQLKKIYGHNGAAEINDLLNTRFFFRSPSADMAKYVSNEIGDHEIEELRESYSYGANTVRDGISLSKQKSTKPIVSASEVMSLPDLSCFLKMSKLPTTRLNLELKINRLKHAEYLIPRKINLDNEVEKLIEKYVVQAPKNIQSDNKETMQKEQDTVEMGGDEF